MSLHTSILIAAAVAVAGATGTVAAQSYSDCSERDVTVDRSARPGYAWTTLVTDGHRAVRLHFRLQRTANGHLVGSVAQEIPGSGGLSRSRRAVQGGARDEHIDLSTDGGAFSWAGRFRPDGRLEGQAYVDGYMRVTGRWVSEEPVACRTAARERMRQPARPVPTSPRMGAVPDVSTGTLRAGGSAGASALLGARAAAGLRR